MQKSQSECREIYVHVVFITFWHQEGWHKEQPSKGQVLLSSTLTLPAMAALPVPHEYCTARLPFILWIKATS